MLGLPIALVVFSLVGLVFFGYRLVTDPAGLVFHAGGAAICLLVLVRNGRLLSKLRSARKRRHAPSGAAGAEAKPTTRLFEDEDKDGAGGGQRQAGGPAAGASAAAAASASSASAAASVPAARPAPLEIREVDDEAALDEVLAAKRAILYKHSTRCVVSTVVIEEVKQFAETHPDWPIYKLNVIERRELSDDVEDRLGIRHQSPQAFIIRDGSCVWNASHGDITAQALSRHLHD